MSEQGLVEVDRVKIARIGGGVYFLLPKFLRRKYKIPQGLGNNYEAIFLRASNDSPIIIRIEKRSDIDKQYINRHPANKARILARQNGLKLKRCVWLGCKTTENIQAHHPDYSLPHKIIALCRKHHSEWHRRKGQLPPGFPIVDISLWLKPLGYRAPNSEQTVIRIEQIEVSQ